MKLVSETFANIRNFPFMNRVVDLVPFCVFTDRDLILFEQFRSKSINDFFWILHIKKIAEILYLASSMCFFPSLLSRLGLSYGQTFSFKTWQFSLWK